MIANTGIEVLISGVIGAFIAQFLKLIFSFIKNKTFDFKILVVTGGMPSSHSAATVALSTSVGLLQGFDSIDFAIALCFSLIVMYDAAGLRRAAGKMATILNRIVEDMNAAKKTKTSHERLMELLGHTPFEVLMGALLGVVVAYNLHIFLIS